MGRFQIRLDIITRTGPVSPELGAALQLVTIAGKTPVFNPSVHLS